MAFGDHTVERIPPAGVLRLFSLLSRAVLMRQHFQQGQNAEDSGHPPDRLVSLELTRHPTKQHPQACLLFLQKEEVLLPSMTGDLSYVARHQV